MIPQPFEIHYIECHCEHFSHLVRIWYDPATGELSLETQLHPWDSWLRRAWYALKYVFRRPSLGGAFAETLLKPEQYDDLRMLLLRAEYRQSELKQANKVASQ